MTRSRASVVALLAALLLAGHPVDGQAPVVQLLHRLANSPAATFPFAVLGLPGGAALVMTSGNPGPPGGVLRVELNGTVTPLPDFPFDERDLSNGRRAPLVRAGDGRYYGLEAFTSPIGMTVPERIWRMDATGRVTTAHAFQGQLDGRSPYALLPGPGGVVYGAATSGAIDRFQGSRVFTIDQAGVVTPDVLHLPGSLYAVATDGGFYSVACPSYQTCGVSHHAPSGEVTAIIGPLSDTFFWEVRPLPGGALLATVSHPSLPSERCDLIRIAQGTATTLWTAAEPCTRTGDGDGLQPDGAPGAVVGFTERSVFRVSAAGDVTVVARTPDLRGLPFPDYVRVRDLNRGPDGTLWAITNGGAYREGEVFRVPPSGTWTSVAVLRSTSPGGASPIGPVVPDADGFVYGSADLGGAFNQGLVYRVGKDGTRFQVLHSFTGGRDGGRPSGLVKTPDGTLWGTTTSGSEHTGTVFRVGRTGVLTTVFVFRFDSPYGGWSPGPLVVGRDGALYGWTTSGGFWGDGVAFRVASDGTVGVLHHFHSGCLRRSSRPFAASDGHLYGVTGLCFSNYHQGSTLFRMTLGGEVTVLWQPENVNVALSSPFAQTADGRLWGWASVAGSGVVGSYAAPLTGGGQLMETDRPFRVSGVASNGTAYGFASSSETIGDDLIQVLPTGEARPYVTLRVGNTVIAGGASLIDGGDGFLYCTSLNGEIFRVTKPGPTPPTRIRIVR